MKKRILTTAEELAVAKWIETNRDKIVDASIGYTDAARLISIECKIDGLNYGHVTRIANAVEENDPAGWTWPANARSKRTDSTYAGDLDKLKRGLAAVVRYSKTPVPLDVFEWLGLSDDDADPDSPLLDPAA